MSETPILILGGTGRTGREIVAKLEARDMPTLIFARSVTRAREILGDEPEVIAGDVTVPETLPAAFKKVTHCICTIGSAVVEGKASPEDIDYQGVVNAVEAAKDADIEHFVLVSSLAVTHDEHPLNQYGNVLKWKLKGENHLRESGVPYTVVRPGGLTDDVGGNGIQFAQGDTISGRITRQDVAEVCIQALGNAHAVGKTFEIIASDEPAPDDYDAIFQALDKD